MSTLLIDVDNDLALEFDSSSQLNLVLVEDEVMAGAIELILKLQMFLGEWFLDIRQGIPYFQVVLVKNPDLPVLRRLFNRVILSVAIIDSVPVLEFRYNPLTREMEFEFVALAADGRKIEGGSGKPFIVDGRPVTYRGT